jgi:hypothetical protein
MFKSTFYPKQSNFQVSLWAFSICFTFSKSVKNLGIIMDEKFTWLPQVVLVHKGVNFSLSQLWQFANAIPQETKKALNTISPKILYGDVILSQTTEKSPADSQWPSIAVLDLCIESHVSIMEQKRIEKLDF